MARWRPTSFWSRAGTQQEIAVAAGAEIDTTVPSHLQQVHAELVSQLPVPDEKGGVHHTMPQMKTSQEYSEYIRLRTAAWKAAKLL